MLKSFAIAIEEEISLPFYDVVQFVPNADTFDSNALENIFSQTNEYHTVSYENNNSTSVKTFIPLGRE